MMESAFLNKLRPSLNSSLLARQDLHIPGALARARLINKMSLPVRLTHFPVLLRHI